MITQRSVGIFSIKRHPKQANQFRPFYRVLRIRGKDFGKTIRKLITETHETIFAMMRTVARCNGMKCGLGKLQVDQNQKK